eukprot:TRINITY_DN5539_c0_g2_i3.p1 TRINITY_DN5539_c0_g2~~TRINITY_DN5539_c0_g2_i3.p1  ORF type:complete len:1753 (-),score=359.98 TRINITY_DN5539_c0_g2_i3:202-5460(-)
MEGSHAFGHDDAAVSIHATLIGLPPERQRELIRSLSAAQRLALRRRIHSVDTDLVVEASRDDSSPAAATVAMLAGRASDNTIAAAATAADAYEGTAACAQPFDPPAREAKAPYTGPFGRLTRLSQEAGLAPEIEENVTSANVSCQQTGMAGRGATSTAGVVPGNNAASAAQPEVALRDGGTYAGAAALQPPFMSARTQDAVAAALAFSRSSGVPLPELLRGPTESKALDAEPIQTREDGCASADDLRWRRLKSVQQRLEAGLCSPKCPIGSAALPRTTPPQPPPPPSGQASGAASSMGGGRWGQGIAPSDPDTTDPEEKEFYRKRFEAEEVLAEKRRILDQQRIQLQIQEEELNVQLRRHELQQAELRAERRRWEERARRDPIIGREFSSRSASSSSSEMFACTANVSRRRRRRRPVVPIFTLEPSFASAATRRGRRSVSSAVSQPSIGNPGARPADAADAAAGPADLAERRANFMHDMHVSYQERLNISPSSLDLERGGNPEIPRHGSETSDDSPFPSGSTGPADSSTRFAKFMSEMHASVKATMDQRPTRDAARGVNEPCGGIGDTSPASRSDSGRAAQVEEREKFMREFAALLEATKPTTRGRNLDSGSSRTPAIPTRVGDSGPGAATEIGNSAVGATVNSSSSEDVWSADDKPWAEEVLEGEEEEEEMQDDFDDDSDHGDDADDKFGGQAWAGSKGNGKVEADEAKRGSRPNYGGGCGGGSVSGMAPSSSVYHRAFPLGSWDECPGLFGGNEALGGARAGGGSDEDDSAGRRLSTPRASYTRSSPSGSPSKQQELVFRVRNTMPLGSLQLEGVGEASARARIVLGPYCRAKVIGSRSLDSSGVDGCAVRDWLCGHTSGPMCLARLLEGMQCGRWHQGGKQSKELSNTMNIYGKSRARSYGGVLGCMVGGIADALAMDREVLFEGVLTGGGRSASKGLTEAGRWLRKQIAPDRRNDNTDDYFEGFTDQQINLAFQRQCIETHPHRDNGHMQRYLKTHLFHEILRQWQEVMEWPSHLRVQVPSANSDGMLGDGELTRELAKTEEEVVKEGENASEEDYESWDDRVSVHVMRLMWVKEVLDGELSELRSFGAYSVLGLTPDASDAELARAYKTQALLLHPDRAGGSNEGFQALRSAYEQILEQREGSASTSKQSKQFARSDATVARAQRQQPTGTPQPAGDRNIRAADNEARHDTAKAVARDACEEKQSGEAKVAAPAAGGDGGSTERDGARGNVTATKPDGVVLASPPPTLPPAQNPSSKSPLADVPLPPSMSRAPIGEAVPLKARNSEGGEEEKKQAQPNAISGTGEALKHAPGCDSPGSVDGDSGGKTEKVTEERLAALVVNIPAEAMSIQAGLALDGARTCSRVSMLCEQISRRGPEGWSDLIGLSTQCLQVAGHVGDAADTVARRATEVPNELIHVLDSMNKMGSKLKPAVAKQVVEGAKTLMAALEKVSKCGLDTLVHSTKLSQASTSMTVALEDRAVAGAVMQSTCEATAGLVTTISKLSGDTAGLVAASAVAVGEAQQIARNFLAVVEAAGVWAEGAKEAEARNSEGGEEEKKQAASSDSDSDAESEGAKERREAELNTVVGRRSRRARLLRQLNGDVLSRQKELKELVRKSPSVIEAVGPTQKRELFALITEVLDRALDGVARGWRLAPENNELSEISENSIAFIFAAAAWNTVAVPSLEGRLLRLGCLLDAKQLLGLLKERVFLPTMAFTKDPKERTNLRARFDAAAAALTATMGCPVASA